MNYRRLFVPGGTYFFTAVTYQRRPIFSIPGNIDRLKSSFRHVIASHPFTIVAIVILPEHLHCLWTLPENSSDFSTRWRLIKSHFTRFWHKRSSDAIPEERNCDYLKEVWQHRFWEHLIRDEEDLFRHMDYIHFNPVKHGYVDSPFDWEYSSFRRYVQDGMYQQNWGECCAIWPGDQRME